jgi:hypothetical protein
MKTYQNLWGTGKAMVQLKENVNAVIISGILKTNNHNILKQVLL